jgi:hypothetical protein
MYHTRGTGRQDTSSFDPVGTHVKGMGIWRLVALQNGGYKCFSVRCTEKHNGEQVLAPAFMLRFGAALAERLELGLGKAIAKNTLSVRVLLPLIVLYDYVSTWNDPPENEALGKQAREFCAGGIKAIGVKLLALQPVFLSYGALPICVRQLIFLRPA